MATLEARLAALKAKLEPDTWEILNPRYYERDDADKDVTEAQWDARAADRIAAAIKADHKIIRIEAPRSFD